MATIEIRKLDENGSITMTYTLTNFSSFSFTINTPASPTPLPQEDSDQNILVKIEGNSTVLNLVWDIVESSTNQITGSGLPNSATVIEQIGVIKTHFRPKTIEDSYEVAIVDSGVDLIKWSGTFASMGANFTSIEPVSAIATFQFLEGTVITLYSLDGPKAPTNFTAVTGGSSGEIDLTWTNPTDTGTGNPALTGYRIQYRLASVSQFTTEDFTPSGTSKTLTGLSTGQTYIVKVAAANADSVGRFSPERTVVAG